MGLFYDRVPLDIASFPFLPGRTITSLAPAGQILSSVEYANTITAGLRNPRSLGWNIEIDRQVTSAFLLRAGFQDRNTARDFVLTPIAGAGILSLSNAGRSFYREFQITGQYKVRRGTLNASYVRSNAHGNLNDFNQFFGNNAVAVIQPDARGRLPFDAPNRFLAWGQWDVPFKLTFPTKSSKLASDSVSSTCSTISIPATCRTTLTVIALVRCLTAWAEHSGGNLFWSSSDGTCLTSFVFRDCNGGRRFELTASNRRRGSNQDDGAR